MYEDDVWEGVAFGKQNWNPSLEDVVPSFHRSFHNFFLFSEETKKNELPDRSLNPKGAE